ncbi:MAG: carbohydrate kinase family protein [Patescibacteria group bacterium]
MYDVLCVGTTTIDLYYKGSSLHHDDAHFNLAVGGKYYADFFYEGIGGGATNVAIGIAKQGGRAALYTEIGQNSFKRIIQDKLEETGVHFQHCQYTHDYYNVSSVLLTSKGERTVINYRDHKSTFLHTLPDDKIFGNAKVLYMGNLAHVSEWHRARLLKRAKDKKLTTIVTLGATECRKSHTLIDDILRNTDILIINEYETADLIRMPVQKIDWTKPLHLEHSHLPLPPVIIVTRGAKGSVCLSGQIVINVDSVKPHEIIDTSGAGDGYVAGFIHGYIKNNGDIHKAMLAGSSYAAKKLSHLGAN